VTFIWRPGRRRENKGSCYFSVLLCPASKNVSTTNSVIGRITKIKGRKNWRFHSKTRFPLAELTGLGVIQLLFEGNWLQFVIEKVKLIIARISFTSVTSLQIWISRTTSLDIMLSFCLTNLPRPIQPGHPSVGRRNEYWRMGRNGEFCVTVGPVTRTAGILAYSRLKALVAMGPSIRLTCVVC